MSKVQLLILFLGLPLASNVYSKEIALTFDDAPFHSTPHFGSGERTDKLIRLLKELEIPSTLIFANPCKEGADGHPLVQLKKYVDAGHVIGNHTCSHPRLDEVGTDAYIKDIEKADKLLRPLFSGQKFFRYSFFNESKTRQRRDAVRGWLKDHGYRNGVATIDNDDTIFAYKINRARSLGKKIDYSKVRELYIQHILGAAEFYDRLALKNLNYSPKHVLLLHEVDTSVLFLKDLVESLKKNGWKLISAEEAYKDKVYLEFPKSLFSGNGIIAQISADQTSLEEKYGDFNQLSSQLDRVLGL